MSDSWSTDVVASDNEGFNEVRNDLANVLNPQFSLPPVLLPPILPVVPPILNAQQNVFPQNLFLPLVNNSVNNANRSGVSSQNSNSGISMFAMNNNGINSLLFDMDNNNESADGIPVAQNAGSLLIQRSSQHLSSTQNSLVFNYF